MRKRQERLARRMFLKAVGAGLAAPLATHMSQLAMADPMKAPTRLFTFFIPHGWPAEYLDSIVLSPLGPHANNMTVVRGLSMNDGATNHEALPATLTGFGGGGSGDSIDYLIAQKLGVQAHVLGAMPYDKWFGKDSFLVKHNGSWVRATESPVKAANELLPSGSASDSDDEGARDRAFRKLALGVTERELETMQKTLSGLTRAENKLSVHLDSIRELKARQDGTSHNACQGDSVLPSVDAMKGRDPFDAKNMGYIVDAQLEVAAEAMLCGSAQVITMQNMWTNSNITFGFDGGPGIDERHHDPLSHSRNADGRKKFAQCQSWFLKRLSEVLLDRLNVPDPFDPSHTVLDNSVVYVCSEISDGADHNSEARDVWIDGKPIKTSLPALLIGGGGGHLKPRGAVEVKRNHLDMLATVAHAVGVPFDTIGGQNVQTIKEVLS